VDALLQSYSLAAVNCLIALLETLALREVIRLTLITWALDGHTQIRLRIYFCIIFFCIVPVVFLDLSDRKDDNDQKLK
jgi:hypothetical protein